LTPGYVGWCESGARSRVVVTERRERLVIIVIIARDSNANVREQSNSRAGGDWERITERITGVSTPENY
jgi:hypothetical protein